MPRATNAIDTTAKREKLPRRPAPYFHKIATGKALGYRATSGQWIARLHKPGQQRRHKVIGHESEFSYDQALAAALEWFGSDMAEVAPSRLTIGLAMSHYLTFRFNERSAEGYKSTKSLFDCYVFGDPIADKGVASTTTATYQAWLNKLGERLVRHHKAKDPDERRRKGRYTANLCWAFMRAGLNHAHEQNRSLPKDEWTHVKILDGGETTARQVFLSAAEAQRLVNVTSGAFRDLVLGGLMTGARLGELVAMKARDLDLERGTWKVAKSKTKNGRNVRNLDQQTVDLLKRLCAGKAKDDLVFTPDGKPWRARYQYYMLLAREAAKLDPATCFYSLRHTYISNQVKEGVPLLAIAQNTGTSIHQIERHYGHLAPDTTRELLARGAMRLDVPESNVVSIG